MSINVELRGGPLDGTRGAVPEPKPVYYGETTLGTSPARYYGNHDLNEVRQRIIRGGRIYVYTPASSKDARTVNLMYSGEVRDNGTGEPTGSMA
jgi:hypothetical protein